MYSYEAAATPLLLLVHTIYTVPTLRHTSNHTLCVMMLLGHTQAALDAMEAYYVKVKKEQRVLQDRVNDLQAQKQQLEARMRALEKEHAACTKTK